MEQKPISEKYSGIVYQNYGKLPYVRADLEKLQQQYPNLKKFIDFSHEDYEYDMVYRPNDDTYFFLDILYLECQKVLKNEQINQVIEIGVGTGYLINHFLKFLQENNIQYEKAFGTDINEDAIEFASDLCKFQKNDDKLQIIKSNILKNIPKSEQKQEENEIQQRKIIICNPPYVPTESEELTKFIQIVEEKDTLLQNKQEQKAKEVNCIDVSYAGGVDGMEITYKIIGEVYDYISQNDIFYLFLIEENNVEKCLEYCSKKGFKPSILAVNQTSCEEQLIIKLTKN